MKRIICAALAAAIVLLSVSGCAKHSGNYKLVDVPEDITVDADMLSDTLQTGKDIYFSVDYPLVASLPDDGVYVYDVNAKGKYGLFVKYQNKLQYFGWQYINATSFPEIYMGDYDDDGEKELAIALLKNRGETNHNEDLHILKYDGKKFTNIIYSAESLEADAKGLVTIDPIDENKNTYKITTAMSTKTLDFSDREELTGTYYGAVQDFTLGDTIYGEVALNFTFGDNPVSVDVGCRLKTEIQFVGDHCTSINPVIELSEVSAQ